MKFYLAVFGCQMNTNDADRLRTILQTTGGVESESPEGADCIIFVTCSIRQQSEDRIFGQLRKYSGQGKILGITGCMVRTTSTRSAEVRDRLFARTEYIDFAFRISDASQLPEMLREFFPLPAEFFEKDFGGIFDTFPTQRQKVSAFVPISTGCDHHCTYCIVPHTRGAERCRSHSEILAECQKFLAEGAREITLLGQNVNRWYRGERGKNPYQTDFALLLEEIAQLPNLKWLRFLSPHPQHLGDDVLQVMAKNPNICRHLHLPVQSGDDEMLRRMARGYTVSKFCETLATAREMMPEITISTDIIVGFCGETEEQFQHSLQLCEDEQFDMIYLAKFSVRPKTPAEKWDDDVSIDEKKRRFHVLNEVLRQSSAANLKTEMGKTREVLVDRVDENNIAEGHTEHMRTVFFPVGARGSECVGTFVSVVITESDFFFLRGEMAE